MPNVVHCRAESAYPDRPTGFKWDGRNLQVAAIIKRWRTPHGIGFLVRVEQGSLFELFYSHEGCEWQIRPAIIQKESV